MVLQLHAAGRDASVASQLNGIFAYALWDKQREALLLVRDRAGIKPLYYAAGPRGIAFGSEIKALFKSDLVTPRLNEKRLARISAVPPGRGQREPVRRRAGACPRAHDGNSGRGAVRAAPLLVSAGSRRTLHAAITTKPWTRSTPASIAAVAGQLMSEVPLGTFCSGGIDSSLTRPSPHGTAKRAINTFSVGFHEAAYDESEYARMAAKACGTVHHELRIDEAEFAELLPKLVWHHDLPLNFANSVHIYAISKLARQHVTVVLTGEGADELFGGYPRYYIPRLLETSSKHSRHRYAARCSRCCATRPIIA